MTDTTAFGGNVEAYSDANAVAFIQTLNTGEVEAATLAKTKATDPEIKAFARQMEMDHTAMKNEVAEAAQRLGLSTTATDEDVLEDHQEDMRELNEAQAGNDFDDKYIDEQVEAHKDALEKIDDAIEKTQFSFGLGILLVIVIMLSIYRFSGTIAVAGVAVGGLLVGHRRAAAAADLAALAAAEALGNGDRVETAQQISADRVAGPAACRRPYGCRRSGSGFRRHGRTHGSGCPRRCLPEIPSHFG